MWHCYSVLQVHCDFIGEISHYSGDIDRESISKSVVNCVVNMKEK